MIKMISNTLQSKRNDKLSQDRLIQQEEQEYDHKMCIYFTMSLQSGRSPKRISTSQYDQHTKLYLFIDITVCDT